MNGRCLRLPFRLSVESRGHVCSLYLSVRCVHWDALLTGEVVSMEHLRSSVICITRDLVLLGDCTVLPWRLSGVKTVCFLLKTTVISFVWLTFSDRFLLSHYNIAFPTTYIRYPILFRDSNFGGRTCSPRGILDLFLTLHSGCCLKHSISSLSRCVVRR